MHLGQFVALKHSVPNGPNLCKRLCREVASEFFAMNAPGPPHWTINWCFGALHTIWVHLGLFGCVTKIGAKMGRTSAKVRTTKSHQNFSQRAYRVHPIRPQTDVLVHFVLFGCILGHLVALRNSVQNGPNKCKSSCHEVVSEFFATNMPNPPHWTLNWCFDAFSTI